MINNYNINHMRYVLKYIFIQSWNYNVFKNIFMQSWNLENSFRLLFLKFILQQEGEVNNAGVLKVHVIMRGIFYFPEDNSILLTRYHIVGQRFNKILQMIQV
ncbi:hypothetical protein ACJX0J_009383, partial [Zea mays]